MEPIQTKARMTVQYNEGALEMAVNIEGDPDMIRTIQEAIKQVRRRQKGRRSKKSHSQPENQKRYKFIEASLVLLQLGHSMMFLENLIQIILLLIIKIQIGWHNDL
jgi:hypothetical protein